MDMFSQMLSKGGLSLDRLNNFCRIAEAGGITKVAGGDATRVSPATPSADFRPAVPHTLEAGQIR